MCPVMQKKKNFVVGHILKLDLQCFNKLSFFFFSYTYTTFSPSSTTSFLFSVPEEKLLKSDSVVKCAFEFDCRLLYL